MTALSDDALAHLKTLVSTPDFSGTRYEIVREIGRGGMATVYEAFDSALMRNVAVKVVSVKGEEGIQTVREPAEVRPHIMKNAEAQLIATLEHPGIVPVHDAGSLPDGRAFYVMKLVRGDTLAALQPIGANELLRLFLRICEPVAFAHARGVVHCDLKPSNVMRGEFGEVLVMDWGIANRRGGTRGYMAPEQEHGDISPAADVFALGTMLRQMMSGTATSRRLNAVIAKATAVDKAERYATARELEEDVTRFLDGLPLIAYKESRIERLGRWARKNAALLAVIGAYLLMRVTVLLFAGR